MMQIFFRNTLHFTRFYETDVALALRSFLTALQTPKGSKVHRKVQFWGRSDILFIQVFIEISIYWRRGPEGSGKIQIKTLLRLHFQCTVQSREPCNTFTIITCQYIPGSKIWVELQPASLLFTSPFKYRPKTIIFASARNTF